VIEIDHHLGSDSEYIGDEGYRLVMEASSSAEIIGYFAYKLSKREDLLEQHEIEDMFPRNFVLAVITGLVGDTNLGQFLPTPRVERSYHFFSGYFNRILRRKTVRLRNYSSQEELFQELGSLSSRERECFEQLLEKAEFRRGIGYRGVSEDEMIERFSIFGEDTIANTSRAAADSLAEAAGKVGIVAYWEPDGESPYIRCSARRGHGYRDFDLRELIEIGNIDNGGGHPGAVGFRVPKSDVDDVEHYLRVLVGRLVEALP
jgi:nanoRNase/pAp phosphatase (c-di-AMP/oligoRNAs hydrolase)